MEATRRLPVGARVRVWAPAPEHRHGWLVGTAVAVGRDAVDIRDERSGRVWTIPFVTARIEVSRGIATARYSGAAGAVGGFLLGEIAGFVAVRPAGGKSTDPGRRTLERLASPSVLAIGAAGAIAGFFVGRRVRGERWAPLELPVDVGVIPTTEHGVTVRLAWRR